MTQKDLIKQAYAYGASVALQDAGVEKPVADETAVKLASDVEGMHPAVGTLLQTEVTTTITKTAGALAQALSRK